MEEINWRKKFDELAEKDAAEMTAQSARIEELTKKVDALEKELAEKRPYGPIRVSPPPLPVKAWSQGRCKSDSCARHVKRPRRRKEG